MDLISYKGRLKWKLRTTDLYDGREVEIDWINFLPEHGGTKYERSRLITSSKEFLLLKIERPLRKWRSELSAGSVVNWYKHLRSIVRWMSERGMWQFSELSSNDLLDFFKSKKARHSEGLPTKTSIKNFIDFFEDLWLYRHGYPNGMRVNILEIEDEIWQECQVREASPWKAMDERFALALIFDALEWMRAYGDFFIDAARNIYAEQKKWVGITSNQRGKLSHKLFADICEHPLYFEISAKTGCEKNGPGLTRAFTITIGAAINILLFTLGQRVSELLRLDEGCLDIEYDNLDQPMSYICGVAAKKNGLHRRWVAADPIPDIVKWLEELHADARKASGLKALFVTRTQGSSVPLPGRKIQRMSTVTPVTAMRAFANAPFRANRPKAGRLHPHAARKTFAAFAVRRDKSALEALSLHFGHTYRAFTDGAYAANFDLQKLLVESDREELGRALTDLLVTPHLGGRAAPSVNNFRKTGVRFRGKLVLQPMVDDLIAKGIRVAPCNWGYCLYSQPMSACAGDKNGPNELKRSPDVCAGCANFVVSGAHAAWWNERAKNDETFLEHKALPLQTREIIGKRLEKSRQILRELLEKKRIVKIEAPTKK